MELAFVSASFPPPKFPPSRFTLRRRGIFLTCITADFVFVLIFYYVMDLFATVILLQGVIKRSPPATPPLCLRRRQGLTRRSFHAFLTE